MTVTTEVPSEEATETSSARGDLVAISITLRSALRIAVAMALIILLAALFRAVPETTTRVILGVVFAFAFDPIVSRLERSLRCTRGVAVAIVGVGALAAFAGVVALVGPAAADQAAQTSRQIPATIDSLSNTPVIGGVLERFDASTKVREWVSSLPDQLSDKAIADIVESVIGGLATGFTVILVGIVALLDGPMLVRRLRALMPEVSRDEASMAGRIFQRTISSYFAGSLLIAILASTFVMIVGLSFGVPLTPLAALWVLIVSFIPQIGGFLSASFLTLLALGKSPLTAIAVLAIYWVYMVFENHVIQPVVVGNAVNLSTAATMLAVLIGGTLFGVPGAILGAPVIGTAKGLYVAYTDPETARKNLERGAVARSPFGDRWRSLKEFAQRWRQ